MIPDIKVSPQAASIYKQLKIGPMTAHEIAGALNILPNAVYRSADELIDLGLIEKSLDYPTKFKLVASDKALSLYLQAATQNFKRQFGLEIQQGSGPKLGLIKDRAHLLGREDVDVRAAQHTVDLIVSGLEVPDSTVLAYRKAATIGVKIRVIVQQKRETTPDKLERWQDLGAAVKHLPDLKLRLIIIDKRITYLTSYDSAEKNSAFGVRFDYEPLAIQMSGLFEQHWQQAEPLACS